MSSFVAFALFYFAVATSDGRTLGLSDNVFCGLFPTVVAVDPKNHNAFPFYVTLYRCQGSAGVNKPTEKKCVAASYTDVRIKSIKNTFTTLKNHTKCKQECAKSLADCDSKSLQHFNSDTCSCDCRYNSTPPQPCGNNHRWEQSKCKCVCSNKLPQVCSNRVDSFWSDKKCSCVPRSAAFKQDQENNSRTHMFIALLALEAVLIAILVSALIYCVRKKRNVQEQSTHTKDSTEPLTPDDNKYKMNYGADSGP